MCFRSKYIHARKTRIRRTRQLGGGFSPGIRQRERPPMVYLSRAKGGGGAVSTLGHVCVSHYGREDFFVDGGDQISRTCPNVLTGSARYASPACSNQLRTGLERPLPLLPDRMTHDRNAIRARIVCFPYKRGFKAFKFLLSCT